MQAPSASNDRHAKKETEGRLQAVSPVSRFAYVDVHFEYADRDTVVPHGLRPVFPEQVAYSVVQMNGPAIIYHDASATRRAWNSGQMLLRSNVANVSVRLLLTVPAEQTAKLEGVPGYGTTEEQVLVGGQLVFPTTQVPSADVHTLDDYEEGSWTPAMTFGGGSTGITYALQSGTYQKIGSAVFFRCYVVLSAKGSSTGDALITGLPFTSINGNPLSPVTVGFYNGLAGLTFCPLASVNTNTAAITLYQGGAASVGNLTDANFTNSSYLSLSGFYPSAAG